MNITQKIALLFISIASVLALWAPKWSHAEESDTNKVKDAVGDTATDTKKAVRKGKRHVRKATGNDNAVKDAKDKVNDAGDDLSNESDKAKRKAEPQD